MKRYFCIFHCSEPRGITTESGKPWGVTTESGRVWCITSGSGEPWGITTLESDDGQTTDVIKVAYHDGH